MARRLLLLGFVAGLIGCWSSYATRAAIHAELLSSMSRKIVSLIEARRPPAVEAMGEYVYPAKRAREFLASYSGYRDYASYKTLEQTVERYEALVRRVDAGRAAGIDWAHELDALRAADAELRELATRVARQLEERT